MLRRKYPPPPRRPPPQPHLFISFTSHGRPSPSPSHVVTPYPCELSGSPSWMLWWIRALHSSTIDRLCPLAPVSRHSPRPLWLHSFVSLTTYPNPKPKLVSAGRLVLAESPATFRCSCSCDLFLDLLFPPHLCLFVSLLRSSYCFPFLVDRWVLCSPLYSANLVRLQSSSRPVLPDLKQHHLCPSGCPSSKTLVLRPLR
jgi:hypothetical protein